MKIVRAGYEHIDHVPKPRIKPWNDHQWVYLADELREWASKEDSLDIDNFPILWGYSVYNFKKNWAKHSEYFAAALEWAMDIINCRRSALLTWSKDIVDRKDWLDRRPLYDKSYLEFLKERAAASKPDAIQGSGRIVVEFTKIPDSDIVKPLPEDINGA